MSDDDEPYKVGPGKPPKEYRWEKGCPSPNPSGRPPNRKREMMLAPLDKVAEKIAAFMARETNGPGSPEFRESFLHKIAEIAAGKNLEGKRVPESVRLQALQFLLRLDREATDRLTAVQEMQFNAAVDYKEYWKRKFEEAKLAGKPLPNAFPHPDDIVIHSSGRVEIVGPYLPQDQAFMEEALAQLGRIREVLPGVIKLTDKRESDKFIRTFKRQWKILNGSLPPRLQSPFPYTKVRKTD